MSKEDVIAQTAKVKAAEAAGDDEEIASAKALLASLVNAETVEAPPAKPKARSGRG